MKQQIIGLILVVTLGISCPVYSMSNKEERNGDKKVEKVDVEGNNLKQVVMYSKGTNWSCVEYDEPLAFKRKKAKGTSFKNEVLELTRKKNPDLVLEEKKSNCTLVYVKGHSGINWKYVSDCAKKELPPLSLKRKIGETVITAGAVLGAGYLSHFFPRSDSLPSYLGCIGPTMDATGSIIDLGARTAATSGLFYLFKTWVIGFKLNFDFVKKFFYKILWNFKGVDKQITEKIEDWREKGEWLYEEGKQRYEKLEQQIDHYDTEVKVILEKFGGGSEYDKQIRKKVMEKKENGNKKKK